MNIRVWNGCTVVGVFAVDAQGGTTAFGADGGAANPAKIDVEIDPWKGLIVDHRNRRPPLNWREIENV